MITYWLMYLFPAMLALRLEPKWHKDLKLWTLISLVFIILIGLRFEVGGDWFSYVFHYQEMTTIRLSTIFTKNGDIGYIFLNWLMAYWELGVASVNLISAIIFTSGLVFFCYQQERPLLAFSIAVPYLIIVVAMGYTRQAVAIGLFFGAIAFLETGRFKLYIALLLVAALFHKTVILLIPLGMFLYGEGRTIRLLAVAFFTVAAWDLMLTEYQTQLWQNYVETKMVSEGAKIRVFMNLIPSLLFLYYRHRWKKYFPNYWFWFWIAVISIACIPFVSLASTAVDRVALYFIPIQIVVFSRLPFLASDRFVTGHVIFVIIAGYAAVLFTWLNYATHAEYWLPYQNFLFR